MGIFSDFGKRFQDDWCKNCKAQMYPLTERLYFMPMTVGHYQEQKDPVYYFNKLRPINDVSQIPTGFYACRIKAYRCNGCGHRIAVVCPFLQVRDSVKEEIAVVFKNGELDTLLGLQGW